MASGAGLNRSSLYGGLPLLQLTPASIASPTTGFADSGIQLFSAIGWSKGCFQLVGPGAATAGYTVQLYVTLDPAIAKYTMNPPGGNPDPTGNTTLLPATSWDPLPGPSDQGGTGSVANPLVSGGVKLLNISIPFVAVRAVLTTIGSPSAPVTVLGFAIP